MTEMMDATLVIKVESELKDFLQSVASSKRITLSAYTRHVLDVGLDEIHKRNLKVRELGKELGIK
jgi:hypothetical protein